MITVPVDLGERSYDVLIGHGVADELAAVLPPQAKRAAIITQANIGLDVDPGIAAETFLIGDGEQFKTMATVEDLCRQLSRAGFTRNDVIVAVGGGIVTDVAGFTASAYHRGIPFVSVPTTLLGQIDAAIGGKTGVNLPEGKNLVGAYWQPSAVLCDVDTLSTLPPREYKSGLGELAKYHFLGGGRLDELPIDERVARCVEIKADVVSGDEREGGRRAILNYGHTLAHSLETSGAYGVRHGEAVATGLVYAAEVARRLGRIDDDRVAEHYRVVGKYDHATALPDDADLDEILALFGRDKKALDGVTFVLDGDDGVEAVTGIDPAILRDALTAMMPGLS